MSAPGLDPGVGFSITVPPSWFELPLDPGTRDERIATLVRERVGEVADLRPHRSTITRLLRDQARDAWDAGARWAAGMVEPTEEGPITASAVVSVVPGPLGVRTDDQGYLDALLAPLSPKTAASDDDTWRRVAVVDLPDGLRASRSWGLEDVDLPDGAGWVRCVQMLQLVPVPGTQRVLLVACSSPVLPLAEVLLDLFEAVCSTLRIVRPVAAAPVDGPPPGAVTGARA